jgi:hypothetical protein
MTAATTYARLRQFADIDGLLHRPRLSTPEKKCISAPEQRCIDDERREGPAGPSGGLAEWHNGTGLPCRCEALNQGPDGSVPAKPSRRFGGLKLGQVELADCPQSIGGGAVLQVVRQCFQPDGVLRL